MQNDKLIQFASDQVMKDAVYDVLLKSFLKKKGDEDVYAKAGRFIAIELLQEAWRTVENYIPHTTNSSSGSNVGL